jgi:eukaryotic-like serine/threonine-protein kinase
MADSNTDRNLLFGVLAMQQDLIDPRQFADACAGWAILKDKPLADILIERGWITADDRLDVERFLDRKLERHGGDVRASLFAVAAVAAVAVRDVIRAVDDPEVRNSLCSLAPAAGDALTETLAPTRQEHSRYRLTRLHAQGGLGKVWLAHDRDLNRDVALKEIRPEQAGHPEAWWRFLKEAQVTGQLEHPGIVPVYDFARRPEDDQPFYTMRFVKGGTLRQAIADHRARFAAKKSDPLDRFKLLQSFVAACQAVGYAHSRGVIHRDLKPENVVLDDYGVVMVLDWGLARMVDRPDEDIEILPNVSVTDEAKVEATGAHALLGTPAYMAPEQAQGRNDLVDARTDIYGLGAILFEILTGRPPHAGGDSAELLHRVATGATPRARQKDASVPRTLDAICRRAMSRSKADRYGSAAELADDVQRWLVDEPVKGESLATRLRRWFRQNPTLTSWLFAMLFVDVSMMSVMLGSRLQGDRRPFHEYFVGTVFHLGMVFQFWLVACFVFCLIDILFVWAGSGGRFLTTYNRLARSNFRRTAQLNFALAVLTLILYILLYLSGFAQNMDANAASKQMAPDPVNKNRGNPRTRPSTIRLRVNVG